MEGAEPLPRRSPAVLPKLTTALPLITKRAQHPKHTQRQKPSGENLKAFCLFHRLLRAEGVDKLLGCPGAAAAAADGEGFRQLIQLFRRDGEAVLEGEVVDNLKVDLLARLLEGDGEAEPVGEGGELLDGVADMQVGALPVGEVLLDQVAAVGGGVDREVGRSGRDAPLEDRLEGGEVVIVLAEGEVVDEEDEL